VLIIEEDEEGVREESVVVTEEKGEVNERKIRIIRRQKKTRNPIVKHLLEFTTHHLVLQFPPYLRIEHNRAVRVRISVPPRDETLLLVHSRLLPSRLHSHSRCNSWEED
jgi:hypothetical protein